MRARSAAVVVAAAALLPACVSDGEYVIRGRIRAQRPDGVGVVDNASAVVTAKGGRRDPAWVGRDGAFEAKYRFGGMGFLVFGPGDGDPHLEVSAPGYRTVRVRASDGPTPEGVTRQPCDPPEKGASCLDVVLRPDPGQRPVPVRPRRWPTSRRCRRGARGRSAHA